MAAILSGPQCVTIGDVNIQSILGIFTRENSALNYKKYFENHLSKISFKSTRRKLKFTINYVTATVTRCT